MIDDLDSKALRRDKLATIAMQALIASGIREQYLKENDGYLCDFEQGVASSAYCIADAMIAERELPENSFTPPEHMKL